MHALLASEAAEQPIPWDLACPAGFIGLLLVLSLIVLFRRDGGRHRR